MPLKMLTEEQKAAGLSKMGPELRALLEDKGVAVEVMASLGHLGLVRLATFANIEQTAEHLRELIEKELGYTRDDGFADRAMVSNLLEAWETAKLRIKEVDKVVAERKAVGRELQIYAPESKSMRTAHEKVWGELEDYEFLARDYLSWRFSQFETGEYLAERATDVVSHEKADDDRADPRMTLEFDETGRVSSVRKRTTGAIPKNEEELRRMFKIMRVQWQVTQLKYSERELFIAYSDGMWDQHVNWLLSPRVWGYTSASGVGLAWDDLLEYDFRVRKEAMQQVSRKGSLMGPALLTAQQCPTLLQRYFTLQLCTSGRRRSEGATGSHSVGQQAAGKQSDGSDKLKRELAREVASVKRLRIQLQNQASTVSPQWGAAPPLDRKGKSKGKGAQKTQGQSQHLQEYNKVRREEKLPDLLRGSSQRICKFFQTHSCNSGNACSFAHVCMRCQQPGHTCIDPSCPQRRA